MKLRHCIVNQNVGVNFFVSSIPGALVLGRVCQEQNTDEAAYVYENYVILERFSLKKLSSALHKIGKFFSRKRPHEDDEETYNIELGKLIRKKNIITFLDTENEPLPLKIDFLKSTQLQRLCAGLYCVSFSMLLPTDRQYDYFLKLNNFLQEKHSKLDIQRQDILPFLDQAPASLRHYIEMNEDIVEFAFKMSSLAMHNK